MTIGHLVFSVTTAQISLQPDGTQGDEVLAIENQPLQILRGPEVVQRTGLSSTTIWRLERDGKFPRRRRISGNLVGWRSDEIEVWILECPEVGILSDPDE